MNVESKLNHQLRRVNSVDGNLPQEARPLYLGDIAGEAYRAEERLIDERYFHVGSDISPRNVEYIALARLFPSFDNHFRQDFDVGASVSLRERFGDLEFLLGDQIFVAPLFQGMKIGSDIVLDNISYSSEQGIPFVLRANIKNHEWYKRFGGVWFQEGNYFIHGWAPGYSAATEIPGFGKIARHVASRPPVLTANQPGFSSPNNGGYKLDQQQLQVA